MRLHNAPWMFVIAACASLGAPSGPLENLERERSKALDDGRAVVLLDFGAHFEQELTRGDLATGTSGGAIKRDPRFPRLLADVLTDFDRAGSKDRAALGDLMAEKARILYYADRTSDAKATALAALPNVRAFSVLTWTRPDRPTIADACRAMHARVTSYFQHTSSDGRLGDGSATGQDVCSVVYTCAKTLAPDELAADDRDNLVTCANAGRRWRAAEQRERENACVASCQRVYVSCEASAEACIGQLRGCLEPCLPQP